MCIWRNSNLLQTLNTKIWAYVCTEKLSNSTLTNHLFKNDKCYLIYWLTWKGCYTDIVNSLDLIITRPDLISSILMGFSTFIYYKQAELLGFFWKPFSILSNLDIHVHYIYMQVWVMINCIMDHYLVINTIVQINQKQKRWYKSLECTL